MANGVTHFTSNVIAGSVLTWLAWRQLPDTQAWVYVGVGAAIGAIVTPDLDLEGRTHTEALMRRIPGVGFIFQWGWYGYAVLFRHRGYSHHILLGTPSRVAYAFVLLVLALLVVSGAYWVAGRDPTALVDGVTAFVAHFRSAWLFAAWWAQDANHYVLDGMFKG